MACIRQSGPDFGLGFQVKVLAPLLGAHSSLGSGRRFSSGGADSQRPTPNRIIPILASHRGPRGEQDRASGSHPQPSTLHARSWWRAPCGARSRPWHLIHDGDRGLLGRPGGVMPQPSTLDQQDVGPYTLHHHTNAERSTPIPGTKRYAELPGG